MSRTLLIDNYDSYTYLIYQKIWEISGIQPLLIKNDSLSVESLRGLDFQNIILSPGPGSVTNPHDIGISRAVLQAYPNVPLLGVCLGHQLLGAFFGGTIQQAPVPMHGKYTTVDLEDSPLFAHLPGQIDVVRYHSLIVEQENLPEDLEVIARSARDGLIMALQHREKPWFGVQFHPESIGTAFGDQIFSNFLQISQRWMREGRTIRHHSTRVFRKAHLPWQEPDEVFAHVFKEDEYAFWLDSSAHDPLNAYAFMGSSRRVSGSAEATDIFTELNQKLIRESIIPSADDLPFKGGWVGFLGYESTQHLPVKIERGESKQPESLFLWVERFIAYDYQNREMFICSALPDEGAHYDWVAEIREQLLDCPALPSLHNVPQPADKNTAPVQFTLHRSREGYLEDIRALQELIRQGESYEVCLTNSFSTQLELDPFYLYRILRTTNPAPYSAFLQMPGYHILSASPENFIRLDASGQISSEPIKGTRPRGKNRTETEQLRQQLRQSTKEHAELLMIIDLIRNDLSMICEVGTVQVPELVRITEFATVLQASSLIKGQLRPEVSPVEALKVIYPGGSITGAPKLRTMEIINRFEKRRRGVYTGSIGYFSLDRAANFNIAIRTMVYEHQSQELSFGSGGAVLFDSDPEAEFTEIQLKAYALIRAANLAVNGIFEGERLTEEVTQRAMKG